MSKLLQMEVASYGSCLQVGRETFSCGCSRQVIAAYIAPTVTAVVVVVVVVAVDRSLVWVALARVTCRRRRGGSSSSSSSRRRG